MRLNKTKMDKNNKNNARKGSGFASVELAQAISFRSINHASPRTNMSLSGNTSTISATNPSVSSLYVL
jgi:hypothetical protein